MHASTFSLARGRLFHVLLRFLVFAAINRDPVRSNSDHGHTVVTEFAVEHFLTECIQIRYVLQQPIFGGGGFHALDKRRAPIIIIFIARLREQADSDLKKGRRQLSMRRAINNAEPWFLCAAELSGAENPEVSARTAPPAVFDSTGNKVHAVAILHRNHLHRLALSERPNAPRNTNPRPLIYPRPAPNESASRTDACNQRKQKESLEPASTRSGRLIAIKLETKPDSSAVKYGASHQSARWIAFSWNSKTLQHFPRKREREGRAGRDRNGRW